MIRLFTVLAVLIMASVAVSAAPSMGEDKTPLELMLENMPPMDPETRVAFDKAARSMYHKDCNCLRYWHLSDRVIRRVDLPMSDADRRLLIEALSRGLIVPFEPSGDGA